MEQHIGLGHHARILALDLWWPASDTRQHFADTEKNQFIEIKEFSTEILKLVRPRVRLGGTGASGAGHTAAEPAKDGRQ